MKSPFSSLICPIDFSSVSANALRFAARLSQKSGAPLTVLHAHSEDVPAYFTRGETAQLEAERRSALDHTRDETRRFAREIVGDIPFTIVVDDSAPVEAILKTAAAQKTALIVMGTHGRSGFQAIRLGSVAGEVLRRSPVPVATVGPHTDLNESTAIVCAVNDSVASREALRWAAGMAEPLRTPLTVLHVTEQAGPRNIADLCSWIGEQRPAECHVEEVTRQGRAREEILGLVAERKPWLLVIGAEHKLLADRTSIGATASYVIGHATVPVVTVFTRADQ